MLNSYFRNVGKFKLLTKDEEVSLSKLIEKGDTDAAKKMTQANLRLAINIAKRYYRPGYEMADLIQASNIGLMKAVQKFDWRRGFRFSTYATWWITQSVRKHISDNSVIRIPAHAKKSHVKIRQFKEEYRAEFGVYPTDEEVSEALDITVSMIKELRTGPKSVVSIDKPIGDDGKSTVADLIPDENISPDLNLIEQDKQNLIYRVFQNLSAREEKIIRLRFGISHDEKDSQTFPITKEEQEELERRAANVNA